MLCYWGLDRNFDTEQEGRNEEEPVPYESWSKISLHKEDYGSYKGGRSEGQKKGYKVLFIFDSWLSSK